MRERNAILIVDVGSGASLALAFALAAEGFAVATAASGNRIVELLAVQPADLVVLSLGLHQGLPICRAIRADDPRVPVVMVGEAPTSDGRIAAYEAGADAYLVEPVDAAELVAWLRALLRSSSAGPGCARQAADVAWRA